MKITIDKAVLEQALEALKDNREDVSRGESGRYMMQHYDPAIAALRQALAQPAQEPAGTWVGLTDEDREQHRDGWYSLISDKEFQAIENTLKEKNT